MSLFLEFGTKYSSVRYAANVLSDSYQAAWIFARDNPGATLADVYTARMTPESCDGMLYCVHTAMAVSDVLISAAGPSATTPAARLLSKSRQLETSNVRYVMQQVEKCLLHPATESDLRGILHFLGVSLLGNLPGAECTAPLAIRCAFYTNPKKVALEFIRHAGSMPLYSSLAEYFHACSTTSMSVLHFLVSPTRYAPGEGPEQSVRRTFYAKVPRARIRRRKAAPVYVAQRPTVDRALLQFQCKRKISASVFRDLGFDLLRRVYRVALKEAPATMHIDPQLLKKLCSMGVSEAHARYIYLHANQQRGSLRFEPLLPEVALAIRKKHGPCMVHVCMACHTLRSRARGTQANRKTSGVVLCDNGDLLCAACNSSAIRNFDASGIVIKSLLKSSDRDPVGVTPCWGCGTLSAFTFQGLNPVCKQCFKEPVRATRCAVCYRHIGRHHICKQVLSRERKGGRWSTSTVCSACFELEFDDRVWTLEDLRRIQA